MAHRFDDRRNALVGDPAPLGISLAGTFAVSGLRSLTAASNGLLAYRRDKRGATRPVVTDRSGIELQALASETDTFHYAPRLSSDGRRVVLSHYEPGSTSGGLWLHELERKVETRLTFDASDDTLSAWSPDGRAGGLLVGRQQVGNERHLPDHGGPTRPGTAAAHGRHLRGSRGLDSRRPSAGVLGDQRTRRQLPLDSLARRGPQPAPARPGARLGVGGRRVARRPLDRLHLRRIAALGRVRARPRQPERWGPRLGRRRVRPRAGAGTRGSSSTSTRAGA